MDFLSSFRPEGSVPLRPGAPIEYDDLYLERDMFTRFLFLTVDNALWKFLQFYGVILRFILTTYSITFYKKELGVSVLDYLNIFLDVLYFVDFLSALIYRCKWPEKTRNPEQMTDRLSRLVWRNELYNPRKIWMFVLDALSLLPLEMLTFWRTFNPVVFVILHCNSILRGYRYFTFYVENIKNIYLRSSVISELIMKFALLWLLISHVCTCAFYWHMVQNNSPLLKLAPKIISFNKNSSISWYLVLFYVNQFSLGNIGFGDLPPTSDSERVCTLVMCLVGFGMLNGYLISALSNALAEKIRRVATLRLRISLMKTELINRKIPEEVVKKLEKFYHSLWVLRKGVGSSKEIQVSLPDSLTSRIFCDIFLPALNASILFRYVDEFSKRAIARVMEINLYMAGDAIMKRSEISSTMFFIRKGTVEIMSYQDDETQIVTYGAGSIFGQIALLLSLPARSEVHAATFCEIHILRRRSLFLVLKDYPEAKEIIFNTHKSVMWQRLPVQVQFRLNAAFSAVIKCQRPSRMAQTPLLFSVTNMLLNVLADKFKEKSSTKEATPENVLSTDLFYKVPLEASRIARNDICVVTTCPFIFEPDTVYSVLWSAVLACYILVIGFYYPYCATFDRIYPKKAEPFVIIADILLFLNLYLSFSTAFTKENILFSSLRVIITSQLAKFSTYIDVISLFPIHYFITDESRAKPVVLCLRCLMLYKIYFLFNKAEMSVSMKMIALLRLVKYILYFFYIDYIVGIIYYLEACFYDPCDPRSWYPNNNASANCGSPIWASMYIAILITSGTGYGDITPKNMRDVIFVILFCFGGAFLFIYLISEYSANISLYSEPKRNFMDMAERVNTFLVTNKMLPSERIRVRQFLNLQWERNQGYEFGANCDLFYDTPVHLLYEISQYTRSKGFHKIRLFKEVSDDILHSVLAKSYRKVLPPHEVVIYAGEVVPSLIMIEEGFCEISYGTDSSLKKIVGAGYDLCTVELMLGLTSLCNVRTLTHCTILKVNRHHVLGSFKSNHIVYRELQKSIEDFKNTPIVQEVQKIKPVRLHLIVRPSARKSLYRFRYIRKQGGSWELKRPYLKLGLCQWIRFILWRATLLPYGKVLKVWELLRCLCAFCSAMLFPLIPFFQLQVPSLYYIGITLDITAWIDLYVRVHVCYYNEINVLVSHPLRTFTHYLKGSFFIDFIFCFPFDRIMYQRVYDSEGFSLVTNWPINVFRAFRVGQIYRIPATVTRLGVDFLSTPGLYRILLMMCALSILFINTMTSGLLLYCINYKKDKFKNYRLVVPDKFKPHFNKLMKDYNLTSEPFDIYFVNFYWVTETAVSLGFGDITSDTEELMIFVILLIILSYLYFNYVTILVASCLTSINMNLTLYQKRMAHLIRFLKGENVEVMLRKHIVNHFEYVWEKQKGMKAQIVIRNFSMALKKDVLLYLYEDTLKNVGAFLNVDQNIFRVISSHINERNFGSGAAIYKAGDIISELFIIRHGEVTLVGSTEEETVVLGPSMIFGLLSFERRGIPELSAVATKNVSILSIKTWELFVLLKNVQGWTNETRDNEIQKLKESLMKSNKMIKDTAPKKVPLVDNKTFYYWTFKFSKYILIFYVILSFFSMNEVSYNAAFQGYSMGFTFILVPIEILFVFKIVLGFTTGFLDEAGDFVSDSRLIRRRYMRITRFYLDFFTVIPFEIFALAFKPQDQLYAASLFRLTKLLRAFYIRYFFNMKIDTLSVNMVFVKMITVTVWTTTLLHQCTCIWYFISCHRTHCPNSVTWNLTLDGDFHNTYINSLYFVVVILTTTGFGDVTPHTHLEFFSVDVFSFVGFFYTAIFIGQIISTVQKSLLDKTNYQYAVSALKTFMHVNDVSVETQDSVLRYMDNIWRNEKGHQIPELLINSPPYLINEVKQSTYGHHINDNPVFGSCNPFFRRSLINELQRTVFFPGDIVVNEGEVNRTVYFVHIGIVDTSSLCEELPQKTYGKNTFFGLAQVLFDKIKHTSNQHSDVKDISKRGDFAFSCKRQGVLEREPYEMTYTARTVCNILSLELKQWDFLSEFYPDDVKYVQEQTQDARWQ